MFVLSLALTFAFPTFTWPAHASSCPTNSAPNKIEGCVVSSDTNNPIAGEDVVIITCGMAEDTSYVQTDSNGHFSFQGTAQPICIFPNTPYPVSVNGVTPITAVKLNCFGALDPCKILGSGAYDPTYGQWAGDVNTDGTGYGSVVITLDPGQVADIPAAELYSNTPFASMAFSMSQTTGSSNSIGISVSIAGAVAGQAGFSASRSVTSTNGLTVSPGLSGYLAQKSYLIDYYCAGSSAYGGLPAGSGWGCSQGLVTAGVSAPVPGYLWNTISASEFRNQNSLPSGSFLDCDQIVGTGLTHPVSWTYNTGTSTTWGGSLSLTYRAITVTFTLTNTVSASTSDTTSVTFGSTNGATRRFRLFPASGNCGNPAFGSELHVWDITGDFAMSANPNSLTVNAGSSTTSLITASSINSFSGTISLSTSSTYGMSVSFNPNPASLTAGGSTMSTVTITVPSNVPTGYYTITITGTSSTSISHSVSISVSVSNNPGGGGSSGCTTNCPHPN